MTTLGEEVQAALAASRLPLEIVSDDGDLVTLGFCRDRVTHDLRLRVFLAVVTILIRREEVGAGGYLYYEKIFTPPNRGRCWFGTISLTETLAYALDDLRGEMRQLLEYLVHRLWE